MSANDQTQTLVSKKRCCLKFNSVLNIRHLRTLWHKNAESEKNHTKIPANTKMHRKRQNSVSANCTNWWFSSCPSHTQFIEVKKWASLACSREQLRLCKRREIWDNKSTSHHPAATAEHRVSQAPTHRMENIQSAALPHTDTRSQLDVILQFTSRTERHFHM